MKEESHSPGSEWLEEAINSVGQYNIVEVNQLDKLERRRFRLTRRLYGVTAS
jgi:hypothetical protein